MPGVLRRMFVHNSGLKIVSLLLAIGLWFAVVRSPIAEVEMKVPIEFHNLPENLEIESASITEAQIRVRGPGRAIHQLQTADVHAEIDLASVQPGERTFELTSRQVHVPPDLEVVQILPGQSHPLIQVMHPTPIRVTVIVKSSGNEKK
jgi:YbbR domain-containing protein